MKVRVLTSLPILLASVAIIIASSRQDIQLPDLGLWNTDKLLHLIAYFFYGIFLLIFINGNFKLSKGKTILIAIVVGLLFAASDEWHQSFVPGRTASIYDFIADAIGIALSTIFNTKIAAALNKIFN